MGKDTIDRPPWLTNEFLENTLRTREGFGGIKVTDSTVHPGVGKGENFNSILLRIEVTYHPAGNVGKTEQTRLMIKSLAPVEMLIKFHTQIKTFEKETLILKTLIPAMRRIWEEKHPEKEIQQLSPYCYDCDIPNTIVMEDLTFLEYKMADRRSRLDLDHSILALKGLALFHALSVALDEKDPSIWGFLKDEVIFIEQNKEFMQGLTQSLIQALINVVERWEGYQKYAEKIRAMLSKSFDEVIKLVAPKPDSLNVLNHGDFWINNMMFNYSQAGKLHAVRFIDFQMSRFSSPALDLQYFFYTSLSEDVRTEKMEYLIEVYHKELSENLKALDLQDKMITLEELKKEFEEKSFFGLFAACTTLTSVLADPSQSIGMENYTEQGIDSKAMEQAYSGKSFTEVFQRLLVHFESKGVL